MGTPSILNAIANCPVKSGPYLLSNIMKGICELTELITSLGKENKGYLICFLKYFLTLIKILSIRNVKVMGCIF
jgi:hypothetical protein